MMMCRHRRVRGIALVMLLCFALSAQGTQRASYARSVFPPQMNPARGPASPGDHLRPLVLFRGQDGLYHGRVVIDGVAVTMLVDTGATFSILSAADAARVFPGGGSRPAGLVRTFGGVRPFRLRRAAAVTIGGRRLENVEVAILDGAPVSVLGMNWLTSLGPIVLHGERRGASDAPVPRHSAVGAISIVGRSPR